MAFADSVTKRVLLHLSTILRASYSVGAGAASYLLGITGCKVFRNSKTQGVCVISDFVWVFF